MQPAAVWGPQSHEHLGNLFWCQQSRTMIPKYLHLGQAIIQIIYLHSFLSTPLHRGEKLFLLISQKWHWPAQLIIIQALWLSWLIGMRVHWSICLRISFEAAVPTISQCLATWAVWDRYCCLDFENRSGTLLSTVLVAGTRGEKFQDRQCQSGEPVFSNNCRFSFKSKIQCPEVNTRGYTLTSPSGCRHWGHLGSDSIHQWRSPGRGPGPAGQQMTPSFTVRGWQEIKTNSWMDKWSLSHIDLFNKD